jgi:hypothetical protein
LADVHAAIVAVSAQSNAPESRQLSLQGLELDVPEGLSHNKKSHRAEAGHAAAIAATMTDEVRARMAAIPLGDATVLDLYNQWQAVSQQLGTVEEKMPAESGSDGPRS